MNNLFKNIFYYFLFLSFSLSLDNSDIYDNSWALIIGINEYENIPELNYAVEDAIAIKNILINEYCSVTRRK